MRSRIVKISSAGLALVALVAGLVYWFCTPPSAQPPTPGQTATRPEPDQAPPPDPAQEAEEPAAAELAIWLEALQHTDPFIHLPAAERLARLAPRHRPAVVWVLLADFQSYDPNTRVGAREILLRLRGKIVPALLETARSAILPVRDTIGEMLFHIGPESLPPLIAVFVGSDIEFRQFADRELHRWGPLATAELIAALQAPQFAAARPRLAKLLLDVDASHAAAATPPLLALLQQPDEVLRRQALEMVARIGPKAEHAPALVAQLNDPSEGVRSQSATMLRHLGPAALPELRTLLADRKASTQARLGALGVLSRLGPAGAAAAEELIGILKEDREYLHHWAAQALVRMGPAGVSGLMVVLQDRKTPGWPAAANAVSRLGPAGKEIAPGLGKVLQNKGLSLPEQESIVTALENIGPDAVPALALLARTPGGSERNLAIRALGRLGPAAHPAAPALAEALRHLPDRVSEDATAALAALGSAAVPVLRQTLRDDRDATLRCHAALALGLIGIGAKEAVPDLGEALRSSDEGVRDAAAVALSKIGPAAGGATLSLGEWLTDPVEKVRAHAARALGNIGPAAKEAGPALQKALSSEDKILGVLAAGALLRIDPAQPAAATLLRDALSSPQEPLRLAAADMVRRLGPPAKEFQPVLQLLLKDRNPRLRTWVIEALIQGDASRAKELLPQMLANRLDQDMADTLERLGPLTKGAIPMMRATLDNFDGTASLQLRQTLVRTLRAHGSEAALALFATVQRTDILERKDPVLFEALRTLTGLTPQEADTVERLADLICNPNENLKVRVLAVEGLSGADKAAGVALSALKLALREEDVLLRTRAVEALGRMGPAAKQAAAELQLVVERDPFPYVRGVAAESLKKVNAMK